MKAWAKRNEDPLIWVFVIVMIAAMILFPTLGLWAYLVFAGLLSVMLISLIAGGKKGIQSLGAAEWIGLSIFVLVAVVGGLNFLRYGQAIPPAASSQVQAEAKP